MRTVLGVVYIELVDNNPSRLYIEFGIYSIVIGYENVNISLLF